MSHAPSPHRPLLDGVTFIDVTGDDGATASSSIPLALCPPSPISRAFRSPFVPVPFPFVAEELPDDADMETPRGGGEIAPTSSPPPRRPPSCIAMPSNVSPPPKDPPSTLGSAVPVSIPHSRSLVSHSARASLGSLAGSEHFVAAQSA